LELLFELDDLSSHATAQLWNQLGIELGDFHLEVVELKFVQLGCEASLAIIDVVAGADQSDIVTVVAALWNVDLDAELVGEVLENLGLVLEQELVEFLGEVVVFADGHKREQGLFGTLTVLSQTTYNNDIRLGR